MRIHTNRSEIAQMHDEIFDSLISVDFSTPPRRTKRKKNDHVWKVVLDPRQRLLLRLEQRLQNFVFNASQQQEVIRLRKKIQIFGMCAEESKSYIDSTIQDLQVARSRTQSSVCSVWPVEYTLLRFLFSCYSW